jgi:hypothetical protein
MGAKSDTPDFEVARIAAQQHGVVTRRQLESCGLGSKAITNRVRKGQLNRVHHGVYAVGHRGLSLHGRFLAAVFACGPGTVLSHTSAAALWKLLRPVDGPVHVSTPTTSGRKRRRGIHLHRCPSLINPAGASLTTHRDRTPVTTIPRTIEDLQSTALPPRLIRRAKCQAELMGHRLEGVERDRTRSDLETLFLVLCAQHHLPPPEVNVRLGNWEVDFVLALTRPRSRDRLLDLPPWLGRIRGRPRSRPRPVRRRVHGAALRRPAAGRRAGAGGGGCRRGAG